MKNLFRTGCLLMVLLLAAGSALAVELPEEMTLYTALFANQELADASTGNFVGLYMTSEDVPGYRMALYESLLPLPEGTVASDEASLLAATATLPLPEDYTTEMRHIDEDGRDDWQLILTSADGRVMLVLQLEEDSLWGLSLEKEDAPIDETEYAETLMMMDVMIGTAREETTE